MLKYIFIFLTGVSLTIYEINLILSDEKGVDAPVVSTAKKMPLSTGSMLLILGLVLAVFGYFELVKELKRKRKKRKKARPISPIKLDE